MIHNYHNVSYTATVFCSVLFWEPQSPVFDPKLTFFLTMWAAEETFLLLLLSELLSCRQLVMFLADCCGHSNRNMLSFTAVLWWWKQQKWLRGKKHKKNKHLWNKVRSIRAVYGETVRYREIQYLWHSHGKRIYIIWQCISKHQGRTSYL